MTPNSLTAKKIRQIARKVAEDIDTQLLYPELCYQTLLNTRLVNLGFTSSMEVDVFYKTKDCVYYGQGRIDILVTTEQGVFVLELKANCNYSTRYKAIYQTQRYLTHYSTKKPIFGIVLMYNCVKEKSKWARAPIQIYDVLKHN